MKYDDFLTYLYRFLDLRETTQAIYMHWVTRCCHHFTHQHLLDVTPHELDTFRLWLLQERHFSPSSDTIVYNAFKHTYQTLLRQVDAVSSARYAHVFVSTPRQPYTLPRYITKAQIHEFLQALPHTIAGNLIRTIYFTGKSFDTVKNGTGDMQWRCSRNYAQNVCARVARSVKIPHGFGLSGVRGIGILHRIQERANNVELRHIKDDSGLSSSQFARYLQVAGSQHDKIS